MILTSAVLGTVLAGLIKDGIVLTGKSIKDKLVGYLVSDEQANDISEKVKQFQGDLEDFSEKKFEKEIDKDLELKSILASISTDTDQSHAIIRQKHSGSGDNVGGNKITYTK